MKRLMAIATMAAFALGFGGFSTAWAQATSANQTQTEKKTGSRISAKSRAGTLKDRKNKKSSKTKKTRRGKKDKKDEKSYREKKGIKTSTKKGAQTTQDQQQAPRTK